MRLLRYHLAVGGWPSASLSGGMWCTLEPCVIVLRCDMATARTIASYAEVLSAEEEYITAKEREVVVERVEVESCMRSGRSDTRIRSSSSVRNRSRISEGSNTCKQM